MRTIFFFCLILSFTVITSQAQRPSHHGGYPKDTSGRPGGELEQKPERGPNRGKMMRNGIMKVEMVTPTNIKKPEVFYYLYDSTNQAIDSKLYTGTVKYVFGGPNQYLQVKLVPAVSGKNNQYSATLEDWKDYKQAIVTMKGNGREYQFVFANTLPVHRGSDSDQNNSNNQNGGQPRGGGMNGGGMNGGGMMGSPINQGRGY